MQAMLHDRFDKDWSYKEINQQRKLQLDKILENYNIRNGQTI